MDERAFSRVAEAYAGRLYAVAYRLLRNRAGAGGSTMDLDLTLREFFTAAAPPRHALARLFRGLGDRSPRLEPLADRFRIEASDHGVTRLRPGRGLGAASLRARGHAEQAREE